MLVATITTQRSGSKLLASCFNSGLEARSLGEIFNPDAWRHPGNFLQYLRAAGPNIFDRPTEEVLDEYFRNIKEVISSVIHFDIMYNQMEVPCRSWNPYYVPFIIGYLMSRNSVIISLERNVRDTYVSGKYLELNQSAAHVVSLDMRPETKKGVDLDLDDYQLYKAGVLRQRNVVRKALESYPYFHVCDYDHLASNCALPDRLCDLLEEAARVHGIVINRHLLSVISPKIYKSGIDYAGAFKNYDTLEDLEMAHDTEGAFNDRPIHVT
jgi:hypothetical protein